MVKRLLVVTRRCPELTAIRHTRSLKDRRTGSMTAAPAIPITRTVPERFLLHVPGAGKRSCPHLLLENNAQLVVG